MDYIKLFSGVALLSAFSWVLIRNIKRRGFLHAIFRIETIVGLIAGVYLIASSIVN